MADKLFEEDGTFFAIGEDGERTSELSQAIEHLYLVMRAPRRTAAEELEDTFSFDEPIFTPDDGPRDTTTRVRSRSITGDLTFDEDRESVLGFVDGDGTSRYSGPIHGNIRETDKETAQLWYWQPSENLYDPEAGHFHISLYLPADRMNFLWSELQNRPGEIEIHLVAPLYREPIERAWGEPFDKDHVFIKRDTPRVDANIVGLGIRDPSPKESSEPDAEGDIEGSIGPARHSSFLNSDTAIFRRGLLQALTWIAGLLALIAVLLVVKD